MLTLQPPRVLTEVISLTPAIWPRRRSSGVASEEAQRNNFANASAAARAFFDGCRSVTRDYPLTDQPRTRLALEAYASSSDTILGQLANADPNVKAQLAALYLTMNGVLARRQ